MAPSLPLAAAAAAAATTILLLLLLLPTTASAFNVVDLGADPTGHWGSTKAFLSAWLLACRSTKPAVVEIPNGKYVVGNITFQGPCRSPVSFYVNGTVRAPNYRTMSKMQAKKWLMFIQVTGLSIYGGTLDGRGGGLWACKLSELVDCPLGVHSLTISNSQKVLIQDLTSMNPELFHLQIQSSKHVTVHRITIDSPDESPNTDGIHVQQSDRIKITNANIKAGDDCISIGQGSTNIYVDGVTCGPGHGISIGSLANTPEEPGVENVTVKTVTMTGTQNGVRIKTWARPSNSKVTNVLFQNVVMNRVRYPIVINQYYCPLHDCPDNQESGIEIRGVTYSYIRGTSTTQIAVKLDCSATNPCRDIRLAGVGLTYGDQPAVAFCKNAHGTSVSINNPPSCLE